MFKGVKTNNKRKIWKNDVSKIYKILSKMWVEQLQKEWNHLVDDPKYLESLYWCTRKENRFVNHGVRLHCYAMPSLGWTSSLRQTEIPRLGHLLVGILLQGPTTKVDMNMCMGNGDSKMTVSSSLVQHEPTLILENENVIPLICLPYIELSLQFRTPVYIDLIYADLSEETCLNLVQNSWSFGFDPFPRKWLHVHQGSATMNHEPCFGMEIELKNVGWKRSFQRQQERTRQFEEELIQKAWHPQRFQQWCLDLSEL